MAARGDPYMSTLRQAHIIPITMILNSNSLMASVVTANTTPKPPMFNAAASFVVLSCTEELIAMNRPIRCCYSVITILN